MLRRFIRYSCIYEVRMSPTLNGSSVIQHFECSNVIEIRDGITFDFHTGLPHMYYGPPTHRNKLGMRCVTMTTGLLGGFTAQ